jgi:hypothetical protein
MVKRNAGFIAEDGFINYVLNNDIIKLRKLDNSVKEFVVQEKPTRAGSGNAEKWDIVVNSTCRIQVKSSTGGSATIVNMVPLRSMYSADKKNNKALNNHASLDTQPMITAIGTITKKVKLASVANKEEWREILEFFLFDGSATKTAQNHEQANYLVEIGKSEITLIERGEAVDYYWDNLTVEIRYRKKSKNPAEKFLHVRIEK